MPLLNVADSSFKLMKGSRYLGLTFFFYQLKLAQAVIQVEKVLIKPCVSCLFQFLCSLFFVR